MDQGIETTDNKISMLSPDVTPSEQQLWLQIETLFNGDRVKGPTFEVPVYNLFKILQLVFLLKIPAPIVPLNLLDLLDSKLINKKMHLK